MAKLLYVATLFYVSAVLCCSPGQRHQIDSCRYITCTKDSTWVLEGCTGHRESNHTTACVGSAVYRDFDDPAVYFVCENGVLSLQKCDNGEVFDEYSLKCVISDPPDPDDSDRIKKEETHCKHGETRKKEGSCKQYYECKNGTESLARCLDCQNYDENEKKCRYVFNSPCRSPFPEPPTTCTPTTETPEKWTSDLLTISTTSSLTDNIHTSPRSDINGSFFSITTPGNEGSTTEVVPNGRVTSPSDSSEPGSTTLPHKDCQDRRGLPDCKYYLECHEGELVTRRCGWLQYFDSLSNSCSYIGYKCYGTD